VCGYCGNIVASSKGYLTGDAVAGYQGFVYICPHCGRPSFIHGSTQIPGVAPGNEVTHLPPDIAVLYKEARNSVAVNSFTAAVLACRKLLMNIAVSQGAKEGESFLAYVEHLAKAGYVPPNGRGWVDHIRSKGNEANHEIKLMTKADAEELIAFAEMLLKFIFEFPNKVPTKTP
jgi:hypothetical protein